MPDFLKIFPSIQKNAVNISYRSAEGKIAVGKSKIGGKPHVSQNFVWPYFESKDYDGIVKNRPLAFLAQFNLAEVKPFDKDNLLPDKGMLYFFYEPMGLGFGYSPEERGSGRVIYCEDISSLCEADFPSDLPQKLRLSERAISFSSALNLPHYTEFNKGNIYGEYTDLDAQEWREYNEAKEQFGYPQCFTPHMQMKLLGYVVPGNEEHTVSCAKASSGIYCGGGAEKLSPERENKFKKNSDDWILLFQMGSMDDAELEGLMGDIGCCVDFYIRKQDLKNKNFDNIWRVFDEM